MKYFLKIMLLICLSHAVLGQAKPDYERTKTNQVLSDNAIKGRYFLSIPHGNTVKVPTYVPDSNKVSNLFWQTGAMKLFIGGNEVADTVKKIPLVLKGAPNGLATLDGGGKVPLAQLPANLLVYKGQWNPATNTPSLANGTGTTGDVWEASVDGDHNFGAGTLHFLQGDFAIYDGTHWQLSAGTNRVTSVNGYQGIVNLNTDDVAEGLTNKYYTDARVAAFASTNYLRLSGTNQAVTQVPSFVNGLGVVTSATLSGGVFALTNNGVIGVVAGSTIRWEAYPALASGGIQATFDNGYLRFYRVGIPSFSDGSIYIGGRDIKDDNGNYFLKAPTNYTPADDGNVLKLTGTNQSISQTPEFTNGITATSNANLYIPNAVSSAQSAFTNFQIGGASTNIKIGLGAAGVSTITAGNNYASTVINGGVYNKASTGTHNWVVGAAVLPATQSGGSGSTINYTATLGVFSAGNNGSLGNYGLYVDAPNNLINGNLSISSAPVNATDAVRLVDLSNINSTQLTAGNTTTGPFTRVASQDFSWFKDATQRISLQAPAFSSSYNLILPSSAGTLALTTDIAAYWAGFPTGRIIYTDPSTGQPTSSSSLTYNGSSLGITSSGSPALLATNSSSTYGANITGRNNANGVVNTAGLMVTNNAGTAGRASGVILSFGAGTGQSASYGAILDNAANNAADNVIGGSNGGGLVERMRITNTGRVSFGSAVLASSAFYIGTTIRTSAVSGLGTGLNLNPTITASANNDALSGLYINPSFLTTGGIATLDNSSLVGGTGYADGTYNNIDLTGGAGLSAQATITVSGGAVTAVTLSAGGGSYAVGNTLSASASFDGAGSGSGFSINVSTITSYTGVNTYGIRSSIATATNRWNLYIDGAAPSYFAGSLGIGNTAPAYKLDIFGSLRIAASVSDSYANRQNSLIFNRSDLPTSFSNKITNSMSGMLGNTTMNFELANGATTWVNALTLYGTGSAVFAASVTSTQYRLSALNTAPASATDTGTLGEVRITAGYIYVCSATNTWVRTPLTTF